MKPVITENLRRLQQFFEEWRDEINYQNCPYFGDMAYKCEEYPHNGETSMIWEQDPNVYTVDLHLPKIGGNVIVTINCQYLLDTCEDYGPYGYIICLNLLSHKKQDWNKSVFLKDFSDWANWLFAYAKREYGAVELFDEKHFEAIVSLFTLQECGALYKPPYKWPTPTPIEGVTFDPETGKVREKTFVTKFVGGEVIPHKAMLVIAGIVFLGVILK